MAKTVAERCQKAHASTPDDSHTTARKKPKAKQCKAETKAGFGLRASSGRDCKSKRKRAGGEIHSSVIKLFVSHCKPNYVQPWCSNAQTSSTSSAFPIKLASGEKILVTNAHSVEHTALVQVKKHMQEQKWVAQVISVAPDCDLALLKVPSPSFWKGLQPLDICLGLPNLQDDVAVVGYPTGGESLSVTQGVVSRVDLVEYAQSGSTLLGIQIDAAINSGNSGGPVVNKSGALVGVAFQNLSDEDEGTENIGYIIPCEVLMHFVTDYKRHGRFTGFGSAGISFQTLEQSGLREWLGMTKGQSGVRVKSVDAAGPACGIVKPDDVVLCVDGQQIGNDGTTAFSRGRIPFNYLLQKYFCGDSFELTLLRKSDSGNAGKLKVQVTLQRNMPFVSPEAGGPHGMPGSMTPRYVIVGGLVFVPLSRPYFESAYGEDWAEKPGKVNIELLSLVSNGTKEATDHEPVLLTRVLASELTLGCQGMGSEIIDTFNGIKVRNLKHLADIEDESQGKYLHFTFKGKDDIVLDRVAAKKALPSILSQNMIHAARSKEL